MSNTKSEDEGEYAWTSLLATHSNPIAKCSDNGKEPSFGQML